MASSNGVDPSGPSAGLLNEVSRPMISDSDRFQTEPTLTSSSDGSGSSTLDRTCKHLNKRKNRDIEESECQSDDKKRFSKSSGSHLQQLSLPPSRPAGTYDVFLSFRGEDTRNNFVGHLYNALDRYGIYTFKDDQKLKKGKIVAPELLKSIEESRYSIVILSENYATSAWCLDELVKIIQCMNQSGQIVVPIFYNVDPSDVRNQTGSFKTAFDRHERTFKKEKEKVLQWKEALRRVGSISGSDSRNKDESVLIEEIVRDVSDKLLSESSNNDSKLVGMSYHMKEMNSLLCNDGSNEVLMVGISGMGGIGKSTISRALYDRYSRLYDGRVYVANVKDHFRKHDPNSLRERLLSEIFLDRNLKIHTLNENFNVIKERLSRKKVFIVLDDVENMEQLETLSAKHDWFGPGSRIIITTRDQRLLISHGVNYLYRVRNLRNNEAFQLFSQYAFKEDIPTPNYLEVSDQFVLYAKGLPLALKILGSFLYKKSINEWLSELNKLKKIPNARIQDVLKISFDGLDDKQKDIFLDIACFYNNHFKDSMINVWESCDFFPETGLRVLEEKSLITISEDNWLSMHDLLQEMGREVVRQESIKEPGERSRLWLPNDICHVFKHNTGTKAVEGIVLNVSNIEELQLTRKAFRKMHSLRLLRIYFPYPHTQGLKENIKVHLPHGLEGLSDELRYLYWHGYPLKCLPYNFQPENLVELAMPYSNLENPWEATKHMKNLKRLDLMHSQNLKDIGDLSLAWNLEHINLKGCISLQEIHPSIRYLDKLADLDLRDCKNLRSPPEISGCVSLEELILSGCSSIENLPDLPGNSLKYLTLSGCSKITELPDNFGDLSSLVRLKAEGIGISGCKGEGSAGLLLFPLCGLHSLKELILSGCNIKEFPEGLVGLSSLNILDLRRNNFKRIDLEPLSNLTWLCLNECKQLQSISNLPSSIERLEAHNCNSLEIVTILLYKRGVQEISLYTLPLFVRLKKFVFTNCFNLKHISLRNIMTDLVERLQVLFASIKLLKESQDMDPAVLLCYPGSQIPELFTHQNVGNSSTLQLQFNSRLVGFIFCTVVAFDSFCHGNYFTLICDLYLTNFDGSLDKYRSFCFDPGCFAIGFEPKSYINSDHVLIGVGICTPGTFFRKAHVNSDHVVMEFRFRSCNRVSDCIKIKRCGLRPVYAVECEEQQMYKVSFGKLPTCWHPDMWNYN